LRGIERDLEALAQDRRVKGLVLELASLEASGATLTAVHKALEPFRAAKKPVWGYGVVVGTGEYRLLGRLDKLVLDHGGRLELTGYQAEVFSLRRLFETFGIRPQFVRRGEFKTAPEMFTRDAISPAQTRTLDSILDDRLGTWVEAVAAGRKLTPEGARAVLDDGPYSAPRAIERKLADEVASKAEVLEQLEALHGEEVQVLEYGQLRGFHAKKKLELLPLRRRPYVAVVPVVGNIMSGKGTAGPSGRTAGADSIAVSLESALEDPRAKSVLLYVDSRGGSAIASESIHAMVTRVARKKPVLAYFDTVAASGGYMAAVGANQVWCAPEAIAGSIGVFAGKFDVQKLLGLLQVGVDTLSRGDSAGLYSVVTPWSERELSRMEKEVEETYRTFLRIVAKGRHLTEDVVHASGEGRVFTGPRALEAKLVDGLCSFHEAAEKAASLGGLAADAPLMVLDATPVQINPLSILRLASQVNRESLWMLELGPLG
jgi:protease-4